MGGIQLNFKQFLSESRLSSTTRITFEELIKDDPALKAFIKDMFIDEELSGEEFNRLMKSRSVSAAEYGRNLYHVTDIVSTMQDGAVVHLVRKANQKNFEMLLLSPLYIIISTDDGIVHFKLKYLNGKWMYAEKDVDEVTGNMRNFTHNIHMYSGGPGDDKTHEHNVFAWIPFV